VREVRWSDIQRVTCNGRLGQLTVIDSEDRKIRISTAMRGITFLADTIAEHVPADRWSDEFSAVRGVSKPDACASPYLRSLVPQQADQRQLSDDETSRALAGVQRRIGSMVALVYGSLGVAIYLNVHDLVIPFNATTSLIRWVVVLSVPLAFTFSWVNATILARRGRDDLIADSFGSLSEEADVVALFDVYRSQTLASAMIQTLMALCCVVAYYLVGSASALAMTIILGIAIRSHSPNADRAARWIKRQLEIVRKQRAAFTGRLALQPR